MIVTITLGPEHDEQLRRALIAVLRDVGAELEPANRAVAGSQEIVTREPRLGESRYCVPEIPAAAD